MSTRAVPATMRALTQRGYGGADVVSLADAPVGSPGPGEVLLQVRASSINFADVAVVTGEPLLIRAASGLRGPRHPVGGRDVVGRVVALGSDVTDFAVGDEVFGELTRGAFAQYAVAPVRLLAHLPDGLSPQVAATLPLAGLTALQALRAGGVEAKGAESGGAGDQPSVLVNGASGGVGTFAVSIAAALGARVTAVCSTRNRDQARGLGAEAVIDSASPWSEVVAAGTHDVLLDVGGGRSLRELRSALTPTGALVLVTGRGSRVTSSLGLRGRAALAGLFSRQRLVSFSAHPSPSDLTELAELVAAGRVTPAIEATYPLEQAPDAIRHVLVDRARGKIVVRMDE